MAASTPPSSSTSRFTTQRTDTAVQRRRREVALTTRWLRQLRGTAALVDPKATVRTSK